MEGNRTWRFGVSIWQADYVWWGCSVYILFTFSYSCWSSCFIAVWLSSYACFKEWMKEWTGTYHVSCVVLDPPHNITSEEPVIENRIRVDRYHIVLKVALISCRRLGTVWRMHMTLRIRTESHLGRYRPSVLNYWRVTWQTLCLRLSHVSASCTLLACLKILSV